MVVTLRFPVIKLLTKESWFQTELLRIWTRASRI